MYIRLFLPLESPFHDYYISSIGMNIMSISYGVSLTYFIYSAQYMISHLSTHYDRESIVKFVTCDPCEDKWFG